MLEKDSNETLLASCSCCNAAECCELPPIVAVEKVFFGCPLWEIIFTGKMPWKRGSYINIPVLAVKNLLLTFKLFKMKFLFRKLSNAQDLSF